MFGRRVDRLARDLVEASPLRPVAPPGEPSLVYDHDDAAALVRVLADEAGTSRVSRELLGEIFPGLVLRRALPGEVTLGARELWGLTASKNLSTRYRNLLDFAFDVLDPRRSGIRFATLADLRRNREEVRGRAGDPLRVIYRTWTRRAYVSLSDGSHHLAAVVRQIAEQSADRRIEGHRDEEFARLGWEERMALTTFRATVELDVADQARLRRACEQLEIFLVGAAAGPMLFNRLFAADTRCWVARFGAERSALVLSREHPWCAPVARELRRRAIDGLVTDVSAALPSLVWPRTEADERQLARWRASMAAPAAGRAAHPGDFPPE